MIRTLSLFVALALALAVPVAAQDVPDAATLHALLGDLPGGQLVVVEGIANYWQVNTTVSVDSSARWRESRVNLEVLLDNGRLVWLRCRGHLRAVCRSLQPHERVFAVARMEGFFNGGRADYPTGPTTFEVVSLERLE